MLGYVRSIKAVFEGNNKELIIPVYQRNYDWQVKHCARLFDDLEDMIRDGKPKHFFGSIVGKAEGAFMWVIIDGQQRLTTTSLLMLALTDALREGEISSADPELARKIVQDFLLVGDRREEKFKLKPIKNDARAYNRLFEGADKYVEESNVTNNYRYFRNRLRKTELSGDQVWEAIQQLEIMHLDLEPHDDPQRIFESLNSTGLDLSEADKIRNFVLMGLPKDAQDRVYEEFWNPIEEFAEFQTDRFIRWYLTSKTGKTPRQDDVYEAFKSYRNSVGISIDDLVADMYRYASYFHQLRNAATKYDAVNRRLLRARKVLGEVVLPFLMPVLRDTDDGVISEHDLEEVITIVESYFFRRFTASVATNALNKIFASAYTELRKLRRNDEKYSDVLTYILRRRELSGRFPSNEEFAHTFATRDFYSARAEYKQYIFNYLENGASADTLDIAEKLEKNDISVEHIMPQHLTEWWRDHLGPDYESIHSTWVNRIGNLTVTGYNSSYSNSPFPKKKEMANGFSATPYRLNNYVRNQGEWTLPQLEERTQLLVESALRIWKLPETDFRPPEAVLDSVPMGDDTDFQGRRIVRFSLGDVEQTVSTWSEMLPAVLQILAEEHRSEITQFAATTRSLSIDPATVARGGSEWRKIDEGLAVHVASSTQTKVDLLRQLFELLDLDTNDLVFTLRPVKEEESDQSTEPQADFVYLTKFIPEIEEAQALESTVEDTTSLRTQLASALRELADASDEEPPPAQDDLVAIQKKYEGLAAIDTTIADNYFHELIPSGELHRHLSELEGQ